LNNAEANCLQSQRHQKNAAEKAVWVTEELPPSRRDIYDETKLAAEAYCREAARQSLPCLSLRISRCFRETDELIATHRLYRGVELRDAAEAHRLALLANLPRFEAFNSSARTPCDCRRLSPSWLSK
jgi:nucleoside-diphosphate-sugar epimerase